MKFKDVDVDIISWKDAFLKMLIKNRSVTILNDMAEEGAQLAASYAPRLTGRLADNIEVLQKATNQKLEATWGNVETPYAIWVEIGSQGRPGRYFLRRSFEQINSRLVNEFKGELH